MAEYDYSGLDVQVVRSVEQGAYLFGVELDGAFVILATRKLGGIDADIERAKAAKAASKSRTSKATDADKA